MKKSLSNLLIFICFVLGISLMLYPSVSQWWNSMHQSQVIATYNEAVEKLDDKQSEKMIEKAKEFNEKLANKAYQWDLSEDEKKEYESILDISGTGIMGYVDIPAIDVEIPIYHDNDEGILQVGIGHIPGSSFPVGGKSTHSVLTGHTGLPSSRLLTDVDQLEKGDVFYIHVIDKTYAYEVDQIKIVLPEETKDISIVDGKDYCTLVTCTPYGVNSHRLLVRGKRISYVDLDDRLSEEIHVLPMFMVLVIAIVLYMVVSLIVNKFRKRG